MRFFQNAVIQQAVEFDLLLINGSLVLDRYTETSEPARTEE